MRLRTVLLVDDDPNIRRITEICLSRMGDWNVTVAASGPAAIEILDKFLAFDTRTSVQVSVA